MVSSYRAFDKCIVPQISPLTGKAVASHRPDLCPCLRHLPRRQSSQETILNLHPRFYRSVRIRFVYAAGYRRRRTRSFPPVAGWAHHGGELQAPRFVDGFVEAAGNSFKEFDLYRQARFQSFVPLRRSRSSHLKHNAITTDVL